MKKGPLQKIYKMGEAILTKVATPVTEEEFRNGTVAEIVEALITISDEIGAVGFAAPQIGYSKRIMIIGMGAHNPRRPNVKPFPRMVFVNPETTFTSQEEDTDWEGCASFDLTLALVSRPIVVQYKAQTMEGDPFEGELKHFPSRVYQHELNHLDGKLMTEDAIETKAFDKERDVVISWKS